MAFQTIELHNRNEIDSLIEREARLNISRGSYISHRTHIENKHYFEFGISIPRVIIEEGQIPILKYVDIDGVFSAAVKLEKHKIEIEWPERETISKDLDDRRRNMIRRAENVLVSTLANKMIQIPKVQNGMNPIKEILLALHEMGNVPYSQVVSRKGKKRAEEYIKFLEGLNFIKLEESILYPGNELTKYDVADMDTKSINNALLADILLQGVRYLTEDLKIYILTPYLELSNAYYLQSYFAEQLLHLDHDEINRHYMVMYRRDKRKQPYQIYTNLVEMRNAEILQSKEGIFFGYDDVLTQFQTGMP